MGTNHKRQNQAILILAIGTAFLGAGLFQLSLSIDGAFSDLSSYVNSGGPFPVVAFFAVMKWVFAGIAVGHYFVMFSHIMRIMRQTSYISGRQLADGPLFQLSVEIWFTTLVFIIDVVLRAFASN